MRDLVDESNSRGRHRAVNREVIVRVQSDVSNRPRLDLAVHNQMKRRLMSSGG